MSEGAVFAKQKQQCLECVDLSRKGSVDEAIVGLVEWINAQPAYFTTSSCSGRHILYEQAEASQKQGCQWLYTSHQNCSAADLVKALQASSGAAAFKFEPFILHTQCRTVQDAQAMHAAAVASGFRNSGITIGKKGKIVVAVRSTHSLEVPLSHDGRVLVSEQYISYIANLANTKMEENLVRIKRFSDNLKDLALYEVCSKKPKRKDKAPDGVDTQSAVAASVHHGDPSQEPGSVADKHKAEQSEKGKSSDDMELDGQLLDIFADS